MDEDENYRGKHGGRKRTLDKATAERNAKASRAKCMRELRKEQKRETRKRRRYQLEQERSDSDDAETGHNEGDGGAAQESDDGDDDVSTEDEPVIDNSAPAEAEYELNPVGGNENAAAEDNFLHEDGDEDNAFHGDGDEDNAFHGDEDGAEDGDEDEDEGEDGDEDEDEGEDGDEDNAFHGDEDGDENGEEDDHDEEEEWDDDEDEGEDDSLSLPSGPIPYVCAERPPAEQMRNEFFCALAAAKTRSFLSDAGLDKILKIVLTRLDILKELRDTKQIGISYRSIKPVLMSGLPKFHYTTVVLNKRSNPPTIRITEGLKVIPQYLFRLGPLSHEQLLRQEGHASLQDIKKFHRAVLRSQGLGRERFLEDCRSLTISVDGVAEASGAKRTMKIVTARFGNLAIYVVAVHSYILKNDYAKPTPDELLK